MKLVAEFIEKLCDHLSVSPVQRQEVYKLYQINTHSISKNDYDLIILDIKLPGIDGFEVAKTIRQNHSKTELPIIAYTALAAKKDKEKCLLTGCNAYIAKPFNIDEFCETINSLLN